MVRLGHIPALAVVASMLSAPLLAQSAPDELTSPPAKARDIPPARLPAPFPLVGPAAKSSPPQFLPADQMPQSDQLLTSNDESSVAEHAQMNGFNLDQGKWTYEQIVCPAFPNHLFLRYIQNRGVNDITVFSASIPRNGEGRVRVIPIQRRSYSLFSPAPINAMTISAFNHIRAEEGEGQSLSWLGNALCYAALAGAAPHISSEGESGAGKAAPAFTAILEVPERGGEVIRFVDSGATPRPMAWTMTFSPKGKLIKATHSATYSVTTHPVPRNSAVVRTTPVP
jgi:hypothetical protein